MSFISQLKCIRCGALYPADKVMNLCPEGAACIASLPRLLEDGLIRAGDRVVSLNTGSLEKYLPGLRHLL